MIDHIMLMSIQAVSRVASTAILALALASCAAVSSAQDNSTATQALFDTWDVVRVAVDSRDQPHWQYRPDDPQLLGRELIVAEAALSFNDGSLDCVKPKWNMRTTTWGKLLGESFKRSPSANIPADPAPADFGLSVQKSESVNSYHVQCVVTAGQRTPAPWNEVWFAFDGPRMTMRLNTSALLVLEKRSPKAAPRPSFSCAKAKTVVEKTLCSNVALAALDRSVATAWRDALNRSPDQAEKLREEQNSWLKSRDDCGQKIKCLEENILRRIGELQQE